MRRAAPITRQRTLDHRGRVLMDVSAREVWGDVADCVAISRTDLHEVLRGSLADGVARLGVGVTAVGPDGLVTFDDGSTRSYDLVVGADDIDSTVRGAAFPDVRPRFLGQVCWRFVLDGEPDLEGWTARLGPNGRTFLTVGLGDGRVYCYADTNSTTATAPDGDWRDRFADFADPVPRLLERATDAYFAPLAEIDDTRWTRPGLVLIGDAAHACSPSMAQGGALALEDAVVLGELVRDRDVTEAVEAFTARREERVRWVIAQNHRRDRARNLPTPVRNLVVRTVGTKLVKVNHAPLHATP
ncbi:FAD-dependent monooxygenase [Umezawaea endophytica]|uniref:FAD-dependent monooxygenase n=1 Tax=Umezawaea endophytica TaxID=1654476 RepID=A0A9X3AGN3_9PSEU|nr:FAD-dependent monooxygenase [Umezawaea endophytica]MCS7478575.1 FAD-dependent monooxygenase [Umezawaea endophytica]